MFLNILIVVTGATILFASFAFFPLSCFCFSDFIADSGQRILGVCLGLLCCVAFILGISTGFYIITLGIDRSVATPIRK